MKVSYKKLWKLLIDKDMNKTDLCHMTGLSTSTIAKMTVGDIVDFISEDIDEARSERMD